MSTRQETPDLLNVVEDIKEQKKKLKTAQDEHNSVQSQLDELKLCLDSLKYKRKSLNERKTLLQEKYRTNQQKLEKIFLLSNKYNMNHKCLKGHKERFSTKYGKTLNISKEKENSGLTSKLSELRKKKDELHKEIEENNTKLKAALSEK